MSPITYTKNQISISPAPRNVSSDGRSFEMFLNSKVPHILVLQDLSSVFVSPCPLYGIIDSNANERPKSGWIISEQLRTDRITLVRKLLFITKISRRIVHPCQLERYGPRTSRVIVHHSTSDVVKLAACQSVVSVNFHYKWFHRLVASEAKRV